MGGYGGGMITRLRRHIGLRRRQLRRPLRLARAADDQGVSGMGGGMGGYGQRDGGCDAWRNELGGDMMQAGLLRGRMTSDPLRRHGRTPGGLWSGMGLGTAVRQRRAAYSEAA